MIRLKNVSLRRGVKVLLDAASAEINPGEKAALVGRNGAGKSSLFALLTGALHEDGGEVSVPAHWHISQVTQSMPETSQSATAFVIEGDAPLQAARTEAAAAEAAEDYERMAHAYAALHDAGAHNAAPRAQTLLLGLGFKSAELEQPVNSFSGGWRMRLQLARALMCPADLLLLDEPTNHLDLDALVWLESWLKRYPGTLLVISHDREFLDAVTNVTLHIESGQVRRYGGNYSRFEEMRALQLTQQQTAFARQQEKITHLQKFIDRFKAKASKAKQAQSRVKALERMEKIAPLMSEAEFSFEFAPPSSLPNPMLTLRQAGFGYAAPPDAPKDAEPKLIVTGVNRSVLAGQRIGILGANGQGKSTVVKTIAHVLPLLAGKITYGKGLAIGYFAQQELDVLRPADTPLEHMISLARELNTTASLRGQATREQDLRGFLGGFQFGGDMVNQPVGSLSGGEKARLVLCMIVWQRPNLLLLDEPTNHLDLTTREALNVALNEFDGTVMLVSHDRALLRAVCDEFWLVARGGIEPFDGDLDDYQVYLLDEARRVRAAAKLENAAAPTPTTPNANEQRRLSAQNRQQFTQLLKPLRQALAQVEQQMSSLQQEKAGLEQRLLLPDLAGQELAQTGRQLKANTQELTELEERWLLLSQEIEDLSAE